MNSENFSNIIREQDVDFNFIKSKTIAIIGYGNQGRAQAQNLNDSDINVIVGLRDSSNSISIVNNDGILCTSIPSAVKQADIVSVLVPDKHIPAVWNSYIKHNLKKDQAVLFSHGYNVLYGLIDIPLFIDVIMVAPSGGGAIVRKEYLNNSGVPTLLAVHQDYTQNALEISKEYSKAIGGTKICAFISTFKEETETDLFGEQAILTGGLPYLINQSFKSLVKGGYSPTVSWFVCYYELKTIVDLFHDKGFEYLYSAISDTARYGGITKGRYLIDSDIDNKLSSMIEDIKSGRFHEEFSKIKDKDTFKDFDDIDELSKTFFHLLKKNKDN